MVKTWGLAAPSMTRMHSTLCGAMRYAALAVIAASAAAMASGVPTCIHRPSSRRPCRRPASAARSNSAVSENAPGGRAGEQRRREDRDAGIDERRHLALGAPAQPAVRRHGEIAAPGIADAAGGRRQQQQRVHAWPDRRPPPAASRLGFTPSIQIVSELTMEERRVAQFGQRLDARRRRCRAAARARPRSRCCGRVRPARWSLDLLGEVMHIDHRALDAGVRQPVEHVIDQRLAGDLHQRLRHACR